jgi:hypothetical protein
MGRGMIPGPLWKRSCIILFIIYFKHFNMSNNETKLARNNGKGHVLFSIYCLLRMLGGIHMLLVIPHSIVCRVC